VRLDLDLLARVLAGIIRRDSRSLPTGKSRLDREAQRFELGCIAIVLVVVGVLLFLFWKGRVF
jgi:hypothetical protein